MPKKRGIEYRSTPFLLIARCTVDLKIPSGVKDLLKGATGTSIRDFVSVLVMRANSSPRLKWVHWKSASKPIRAGRMFVLYDEGSVNRRCVYPAFLGVENLKRLDARLLP